MYGVSTGTKQLSGRCKAVAIVLSVAIGGGLTAYEIETVNTKSYLPKIAILRG